MLDEAPILSDTVRYFIDSFVASQDNLRLVLITTEKENLDTHNDFNTIALARDIARTDNRIIHIHYPMTNGNMAHQLNYAISELNARTDMPRDDDLFAIYNADSRPEKQTFSWIQARLDSGHMRAFQQYGCYMGNITGVDASPWNSTLIAACLWQTRWAMGFEIYHALKQFTQSSTTGRLSLNYPFNYCIGHGLFITNSLYRDVGGFSEDTHNEDAALGLQLCAIQEPLIPIPYFDISESPDTMQSLYQQKANWYFGPLQAYFYARTILARSRHSSFEKGRILFLATKLFSHAVFWIAGPTLALIALIAAIALHNIVLFIAALFSLALFAMPSIVSYMLILRLAVVVPQIDGTRASVHLIRGFLSFYLLHGASAYRGLSKLLAQSITGRRAVKEKTVISRSSFRIS